MFVGSQAFIIVYLALINVMRCNATPTTTGYYLPRLTPEPPKTHVNGAWATLAFIRADLLPLQRFQMVSDGMYTDMADVAYVHVEV